MLRLLVLLALALAASARSAPCGGCPYDWDMNDAKAMLAEAYQARMQGSNDFHRRRVIKVESASQQIVAGTLYRVAFLDGETTCTQQTPIDQVDEGRCPFNKNGRVERCEMEIWEQVWNPEHDDSPKFECTTLSGDEKRRAFE